MKTFLFIRKNSKWLRARIFRDLFFVHLCKTACFSLIISDVYQISMLDAETIPFIKYQNNLNKNQLFDQPYKWEQMQSKCSWLAQMLTDKLAPDKTDKTMTCIMAWLLLTFGNICRGFLKKKLTTGKQVTKPLLKNTQQKTYDTPVILNHSSSVRFSPN